MNSDPAVQWSGQLGRLDDVRRDAVVGALRHSASRGWPASREAVDLLVAYALGEISSRDYATGIMRTWQPFEPDVSAASQVAVEAEPVAVRSRREEAVHAYVTGQIDVGEFLRIARS